MVVAFERYEQALLASDVDALDESMWRDPRLAWSCVGFPAISVHAGRVDGLPAGIQFVAPPQREAC